MARVERTTSKNWLANESTLVLTQKKSMIGAPQKHRDTVRSLGLKRVGDSVERKADAATVGMINSVKHLVTVEEASN